MKPHPVLKKQLIQHLQQTFDSEIDVNIKYTINKQTWYYGMKKICQEGADIQRLEDIADAK